MSVILEYAFRSDGLVLAPALDATDVRLDLEGVTASRPTHPQLFGWVKGDLDAFDAAVAEDPTVDEVTVLSDHGDRRLYRFRTTDDVETVLYPLWVDLGGEALEAHYEGEWWRSQVRFPDRSAVSAYRDTLLDNGVEFRLEGLYDEEPSGPGVGLTPEQRETLKLAYRRGYFEVPRGTTAADLAAELGVSTQAVSERLRRGYASLVSEQVAFDEGL
ncbi:helix-turn-helix domain-containing protein [Halosegnis marinus]|uniref:Helix-turn-helix domain-containing protein n=1 Tax=Halosegnis marinus TaxID=3034023 RepID=A0ABD5ZLQ9_9EURY|nr:helix-turn-helix domain-containing protein [Halosegnis sp. DT85]